MFWKIIFPAIITVNILFVVFMYIRSKRKKGNTTVAKEDAPQQELPAYQHKEKIRNDMMQPPKEDPATKNDAAYKLIIELLAEKGLNVYQMDQYDFIDAIKSHLKELSSHLEKHNASIDGEKLYFQTPNIASRLHTCTQNQLKQLCKVGTGISTQLEFAGHAANSPINFNTSGLDCLRAKGIIAAYAIVRGKSFRKPPRGKKVGRWYIEVEYWNTTQLNILLKKGAQNIKARPGIVALVHE